MSTAEHYMRKPGLSLYRVEALTDGVFAIVMTLLVLGLGVPVFKGSSMHQEFTQLLEMWPKFASYVVTFLMLGFIWSVHHRQFSLIKRSDSLLVWLNIIFLIFVALLPFSTSLLGEYMGQQLPILVYEGNIFMCILFGYTKWSYATGKYRLVDTDIDSHEIRRRKIILLGSMAFVAIAMGISFLNTIASLGIFFTFLISVIIYSTLRFRIRTTEQVAK
jgi:uncharacterized membrane protein